jgi:hypothetical protein
VRAIELGAEEAAPLLRESLLEVGPITRSVVGEHFAVALDAPLADWVAEAPLHPVFILEPAD